MARERGRVASIDRSAGPRRTVRDVDREALLAMVEVGNGEEKRCEGGGWENRKEERRREDAFEENIKERSQVRRLRIEPRPSVGRRRKGLDGRQIDLGWNGTSDGPNTTTHTKLGGTTDKTSIDSGTAMGP